ncbi:CPBP family intramembrane glutamic endopeptidase [Spirochaeta dissipatitropha]
MPDRFGMLQAVLLTLLLILTISGFSILAVGLPPLAVSAAPIPAYILAAILYFSRLSDRHPAILAQRSSLPIRKMAGYVLLYFAAYIPAGVIHYASVQLLPPPPGTFMLQEQLLQRGLVMAIIFLAVLPALLEEFFFRGIICLDLVNTEGRTRAVILSGLLFAFAHMNPWQFTPALILGMVLGWIAISTKSIRLPILLHLITNSIAILQILLQSY